MGTKLKQSIYLLTLNFCVKGVEQNMLTFTGLVFDKHIKFSISTKEDRGQQEL